MQPEEGEQIIDKVEKDFNLVTKVQNLQLHIKGDMWPHH